MFLKVNDEDIIYQGINDTSILLMNDEYRAEKHKYNVIEYNIEEAYEKLPKIVKLFDSLFDKFGVDNEHLPSYIILSNRDNKYISTIGEDTWKLHNSILNITPFSNRYNIMMNTLRNINDKS